MSQSTLSVFQACREEMDYTDGENGLELLQCVSSHLESAAVETQITMRSYLLLLSGALVFFMQAGFAMVVAGSVRRKNTQNSMLKNLLDACGAAIAYYCVGYAFAFGGDMNEYGGSTAMGNTTFVGLENFFGTGEIDLPFYFFQYTFFAASVTIVAGTLAERCQMAAYLGYSFFLTGWVYPVVAHTVWSTRGFLSPTHANPLFGVGLVDFSGSGVVHCTGGFTALYATKVLGSRRGRFYDVNTGAELDNPRPMPGHSVSLQMLGTMILWFGWFGFNPGSALLLTDNPYQAEIGALCAVNTFLASSGGAIAALMFKMILIYRENGEFTFDIIAAMNGLLAGLVSVCYPTLLCTVLHRQRNCEQFFSLNESHLSASICTDHRRMCCTRIDYVLRGRIRCWHSLRPRFRIAGTNQD
jgi:ammonium transporter, Amt family